MTILKIHLIDIKDSFIEIALILILSVESYEQYVNQM